MSLWQVVLLYICCYICVLIILYMCPHTVIHVSSYYYKSRVLMLLYVCPRTTMYVSACCYICVLIPPKDGGGLSISGNLKSFGGPVSCCKIEFVQL